MAYKSLAITFFFFLFSGCSKTPIEYFELAENSLNEDQVEMAIQNLEKLIVKYPLDSLAAKAQYKLAMIHLNWKNDLSAGFIALEKTVSNYGTYPQAEQAKNNISDFPEWILNQSESLRKKKMIKESLGHLVYLAENYSDHTIAPKGQYLI